MLGPTVLAIVGAGAYRAWKWFIERPLEKAETRIRDLELRAERAEVREDEQRRRADMLAGELKATTTALRSVRRLDEFDSGAPVSMPPPREELPTLEHIIESRADRAWAEQRERERQRPLNPALDRELESYQHDMASTPPGGFDPPEGLKPLSKPFPPPRRRR